MVHIEKKKFPRKYTRTPCEFHYFGQDPLSYKEVLYVIIFKLVRGRKKKKSVTLLTQSSASVMSLQDVSLPGDDLWFHLTHTTLC